MKTKKSFIFEPVPVCAVGAAVNLALSLVKLYIGISTNSVSIYADSLNNFFDCVICLTAIFGFRLAAKPSDERYPFGYGRAEDLVGFLISLTIGVSAFAFGYVSLERVMYPVAVWYNTVYAVDIAATAVVKLLLLAYYKAASKRNGSSVITGLCRDCVIDFFITLCALTAFTLSAKADFSIDGFAGMAVSAVLLVDAILVIKSSAGVLIGRTDAGAVEKARKILSSCGIDGIIRIGCHRYGSVSVFDVRAREPEENGADAAVRARELFKSELGAELFIDFSEDSDED